ncbi:metalloregulator ArsR/SmtB family transcription factor [Lentibacter algarum]|uniref:metalloregulator ArsR/SmtB family transcription factor n=1 Tax=Lentibacter algarum TaxID=576131 RepID=UPI001C07BDBC|nr:metalloregulator ArsR/SmtB family transcription factor [Lentibacter algarum]MBU2982371.1 metalloregulator ArsR/SmtB family transcription factor [Lentibacter algarum]
MNYDLASQLSALSHPQRLDVFKLLLRRYPDELPAGEIAQVSGLKASSLSDHLAALRKAALAKVRREGTSLHYSVDLDGTRALNKGLFSGCCRNRADLCDFTQPLSGNKETPMPTPPYKVLFICSGNSARSIMAETILRDLGEGLFEAYSAGAKPSSKLNDFTVEILSAKGHDVSPLYAKNLSEFQKTDAPKFDFVFTVCDDAANEECPAWPGQPVTAHWGMPDPVKATGTEAEKRLAFQQAYGTLQNRLKAFVVLPIDTLNAISLQHAADDIGKGALLSEDKTQ